MWAYLGMERDRILTFSPVDHPDPRVQRVGFDILDPYVEQCWSAVVGPSTTLLLRRLPVLWVEQVPAHIEHGELARSLGLGAGTGPNSRLAATLDRLVRFGMARRDEGDGGLDVHLQVAPLQPRQLERLPEWTRATHDRLFSAHIEGFDSLAQHQAKVASITARLDQLQRPKGATAPQPFTPNRAIGR